MTDRNRTLHPDQSPMFVLRDAEGRELGKFPYYPPSASLKQDQPGLIGGAFKRGTERMKGDFVNTGGLLAEWLGSEEMAQGFYAKAKEYHDNAAEFEPVIGRVENIEDLGDIGTYAVEVLAENAPILLSMAVPGGMVAKGAQLLGAGVKAASAAGASAAFLSNVGQQTGESVQIARDAGESPVDMRVVGSGIGKASLDFVPLLAIAKRIGLAKNLKLNETLERLLVGNMAEGGYIRRAAGHSGAIVAREVPTEVMQEYINISLDRALKQHEGDLTPEEKSQLINAAAGATAFGLLGIPAGLRRPPAPDQEGDKLPPETKALPPPEDPDGSGGGGGALALPDLALEGEYIPAGTETGDATIPRIDRYEYPALEGETARPERGGVKADLHAVLKEHGEPVANHEDATRRWNAGERIFAFHEMDEGFTEVESIDHLRTILPDQLLSVPRNVTPEGGFEFVDQMDTDFFVGADGQVARNLEVEPLSERVDGTDAVSMILNATAEQLEVARHYPEYIDLDPKSNDAQAIASLHPGLQTLFERKADLLSLPDNYRTTDGQLKKNVQRQVDVLDTKIRALQTRLGITPANQETTSSGAEGLQRHAEPAPAPAGTLSEAQKQTLLRLDEKERFEGLTDAEYDTYVKLKGIATGEITPAQTRAQTDEELAELKRVEKRVRKNETVRENDLFRKTDPRRTPYKVGVDGTGIKVDKAIDWLKRFTAKFVDGPGVMVHSFSDPIVQQKLRKKEGTHYGWWNPNEPHVIHIVADNHHDVQDLLRTYLHETLAHYGLRRILTAEQMRQIMTSLQQKPPPGYDADAISQMDEVDAWIETEEFIASYAETLVNSFDPTTGVVENQGAWGRVKAIIKKALRALGFNMSWKDHDLHHLLRNVSRGLSGQFTLRNKPGEGGHWSPATMNKVVGEEYGETVSRVVNNLGNVWGARWRKWFLTPVQFASKYNVPGSQEFLNTVQEWWGYKRRITDDATLLGLEIMKMGKQDQQKISELVLEISIRSDEKEGRLTETELQEVFKELGVLEMDHIIKQWRDMDKSMQDLVTELRNGMEVMAIQNKGSSETAMNRAQAKILWKQYRKAMKGTPEDRKIMWDKMGAATMIRLSEIEAEMKQLSNRNYFPRMRFGTRSYTVRAQKDMTFEGKTFRGPREGKRGDVIYFETFENDVALESAAGDLDKRFSGAQYQTQKGEISEQEFHFMGVMSPQLYESLLKSIPHPSSVDVTGKSAVELDALFKQAEQMKENLREVYLQHAPGRSFLRHLKQRKGIAGYSEDVLRVYSSYVMNIANHIARLRYHTDMNIHLKTIADNAANVVPDARVEGIVRNYFQEQYDYIMNPENDLAQLRALGFLWYLGFNVKSALVNLTQVPMVAYPYLASQYGDAKSSAAIISALRMVTANRVKKQMYPDDIRAQIERGIREGFIDESRATELAGMAENNVLQRLMPGTTAGRLLSETSYRGAWLFQHAEKINREATFIAAYQLARDNGITNEEELYKIGRKAVQTAMFEYSKWNRAAFMRGKKSVFFLFWQYMQGLSYIAFGGAGSGAAMRVWMMLLLAGGLQGLPFAENIMDVLDFVGTKGKERLGMKDPRVDLRADLRELAAEITDRPDMIMHGMSRYYGAGPLHLAEIMGIPVPNVDISGSLSAGRVIPGTEEFTSSDRDPNAKLARFMVDAMGPVAGIGYGFWRAAIDDNPDTWKTWERAMPSFMKSLSKGARRMVEGEETYRGGGTLAQFDPHNLEHRAENLFQMLGFATTRVNQRYEADFSVQNMKQYWAIHRAMMMEDVAYARMSGDREAIADANRALREFNSNVPDPALRINSDQLSRSLKQRFRRGSLRERGIPSEQLYRRIVREMRELFPESSVDIQ